MTALQDWLSLRPVDHSVLRGVVCRPLRSVLNTVPRRERPEFTMMGPGAERC